MGHPDRSWSHARFDLQEKLGEGAYGTVHMAYDRERDQRVALKRLRRPDPQAIYRFKREFRVVADLGHPNLVELYDLFGDGDDWFFTMELVRGEPLGPGIPFPTPDSTLFEQLAQAVSALHRAGILHRDLKPTNVLVTPAGRVVLLDFGFASENCATVSTSHEMLGTPLYMAPEQARSEAVTEAADWYAFGAILYERLTGEPPFVGSIVDVLLAKQDAAPPAVHQRCPGLSRDLSRLIDGLLLPDPAQRPCEAEVLAVLGGHASSGRSTRFVGRADELATLEIALGRCREVPQVVWVEGASGLGKTALLDAFALRCPEATVLRARCHEQESLPYKALDGVVDGLSRELERGASSFDDLLSPSAAAAVVQLFPVLGRVAALSRLAARGHAPRARERARVAGADALRSLIAHVAQLRPLVLLIDDLQWGDVDSAWLLRELFLVREPPAVLLVAMFRAQSRSSPTLATLLPFEAPGSRMETHTLTLDGLGDEDARALVQLQHQSIDARSLARVLDAGAGNPFLLGELTRSAQAGGDDLEWALTSRLQQLSRAARSLLDALSVAGHPLHRDEAAALTGVRPRDLELLRRLQLVVRVGEELVPYHDRIREMRLGALGTEERRRWHGLLGDLLEQSGGDPERTARHLEAAGHLGRAYDRLVEAAERAASALAWERAERLYARAIALHRGDGLSLQELRVARAEALANAGRGADAAAAYAEAHTHAAPSNRAALLRLQAEQLLRCGRLREGYRVLEAVMGELDLTFPRTAAHAIAGLLAQRMKLKLGGLRFRPQPPDAAPPRALQRVDLCFSVGAALGFIDSPRGAYFLSRSLAEALEAGEPFRVARSLAYEACFVSNRGSVAADAARDLLDRSRDIATDLADAYLLALCEAAECVVAFHGGDWRLAIRAADAARVAFEPQPRALMKEIMVFHLLEMTARVHAGDFEEGISVLAPILRRAEERGDLFTLATLSSGPANLFWLAVDQPDEARTLLARKATKWTGRDLHLQDALDLYAHAQIDLYEGDPVAAEARIVSLWSRLQRSLLTRQQYVRCLMSELRGRATLGAAHRHRSRRRKLIPVARESGRYLTRQPETWAVASGRALEAATAWMTGDHDGARATIARAAAEYEGAGMRAHVAAAQWLRARWDQSERRAEAALEALASLGVACPETFVRTLVPVVGTS